MSDECSRYIYCGDSSAKDGCEVGKGEHLELDECIRNIHCLGGCNRAGGHAAGGHGSPRTQESGMPEEILSLMEPQPGQVGWTDDSLEMIANPREGGHGG